MIKYENEVIDIECEDVSQMLQEASMLVMGVVRKAQEMIPSDVPADFLVTDLFKSLRFAALMDDGKTEEEAFEILNGKPQQPKIEV